MQLEYEKNIKPILDTFDKIREILRFEAFELPKIVVVGDQSSGKSSVLESITGVSLPRGENTVTKCPIILQMREVNSHSEEYATVRIEGEDQDKSENQGEDEDEDEEKEDQEEEDQEDEENEDQDQCEEEQYQGKEERIQLKDLNSKIKEVQEEVIRKSKHGITDTPIYVYVRKVGSPNLTLYDLPGITYKEEKLTEKIKEIITKYTEGKETLILLVIPANSDLTTSEAISLIRKHKDYTDRTISIITKIDLVEKDKNLYKKIMNNELGLKYNPIVVRNRNQDELETNHDLKSIRTKEIDLIKSNSELSKLPEECKGTAQLINRIIQYQTEKLKTSKLEIRIKILEKLRELRKELSNFPLPAGTLNEKIDRFRECLTELTTSFSNLIRGKEVKHYEKKFYIGSRLREKFESFFLKFQESHGRFFSDEFCKKVTIMLSETRGLILPNFFDSSDFHSIISKEITSKSDDIIQLLDEIKIYISEVLFTLINKAFGVFPTLNKLIQKEITYSINTQTDEVRLLANELIECEKEGEWTVNPYYMDIIMKVNASIKEKQLTNTNIQAGNNYFNKQAVSNNTGIDNIKINDNTILEKQIFTKSVILAHSNEEMNVRNIQVSCFSYWKVFEKRFVDYYEMIILRKLVYFYQKNLGIMIEKKFSPTSLNNSLEEDFSITKRRQDVEKSIKNLESANEELSQIL